MRLLQQFPVEKIIVWALFLLALYLLRDFFFTLFMTFLFTYLTNKITTGFERLLSRGRNPLWLHRVLTIGVFAFFFLTLWLVGNIVASRVICQGQNIVGWLSRCDPQAEITRMMQKTVGSYLFKQTYGAPGDARYEKGLKDFQNRGKRGRTAYDDFPSLVAWVEGSFSKRFEDEEKFRLRMELLRQGNSNRGLDQWLLKEKLPALQAQAAKNSAAPGNTGIPPGVSPSILSDPERFLDFVKQNPTLQTKFTTEWNQAALDQALVNLKSSPEYEKRFHEYYDARQEELPKASPYNYDQYVVLKKAYVEGEPAFMKVFRKSEGMMQDETGEHLRSDFEETERQELFLSWWKNSALARMVQEHLTENLSAISGSVALWLEKTVTSFLNIPFELSTALLLSFFLSIDLPNIQRRIRTLRTTWLGAAYDEIAPGLLQLAHLIGKAFFAQGVIAFCNSVLTFIGLKIIGVEHETFLSLVVFVCCFVPVIGVIISSIPLLLVALIQPGGGIMLALETLLIIMMIQLLETMVLSPRIVGKIMEVHPVVLIAVLPIAQYFFGVWGLVLGTPVTVYVISSVIFNQPPPGIETIVIDPANNGKIGALREPDAPKDSKLA